MPNPLPSRSGVAVLIAVVGVAVLTAFAALAPPGMKKLLLFSLAFGLCTGGIVAGAAREFGLDRRWAVCLAVPLVVAGLSFIAAQGLFQLRAEQAAAFAAHREQPLIRGVLDAAAAHDPQLAAELAERRRHRLPSFADYLALRVKPLGEWLAPWPGVFWGVELILAVVAATVIARRILRSPGAEAARSDAAAFDQTEP